MATQETDNKPLIISIIIVVVLAGGGWLAWYLFGNQLRARDQLVQGIRAYKNAQFTSAIEHFKKAVSLDPKLFNARLYLATAYANLYIPGAESDENLKAGQQAIDEFKNVLAVDKDNPNAVAGIASLYFQMKKLDDAKVWYQKQMALTPSDPIPYYSVGVIDWGQAYPARMKARVDAGMDPQAITPFKDTKKQAALCSVNLPILEDGFKNLNEAVKLNPDYDDAMAYINLLYREKADCETDPKARDEDFKNADLWVDKLGEVRKKKANATPSGTLTK